MKTFNDNAGRTWSVTINVDAIKRVKTLLKINLLEAVEGDLLEKLSTDPILLCDVLYAVCKPQADALAISDEDFGRAMAGDAIERATTALLEELVDFFPSAKRRILTGALEKLREVEARAIQYAEAKLHDPEFDKRIEAMLNDITGSVSSSAASPKSSHGASP